MLLFAAADIHGNHDVYDWLVDVIALERPDAVVLAGDLLGCPGDCDAVEEAQAVERQEVLGQLSQIQPPMYYVMGNDDWIELQSPVSSQLSIHGKRVDSGEYNFVGYQNTLPFMGGINEKPEVEIEKDLALIAPKIDEATVLVTHGPAYGTLDLATVDRHAGSLSLRDLVRRRSPRLHIHGHIHGQFGRSGRHFNVASGGKKRAMLLDVAKMSHRLVEGTA